MIRIYTLLAALILSVTIFAQSPRKMSYQAVVRNNNGELLINQDVGMRVSILQDSPTGTEVYKEIYNPNPKTNANGLISVEIGGGIALTGAFSAIDWGSGEYFIKTESDPAGGTNYTITGISQLLSVPYALHAKTAESVTGGLNETDPEFTASPAAGIIDDDLFNLGNLSGVNTGDQDLNHLATIAALQDSINMLRNEIPDADGISLNETDPEYTASPAAGIIDDDLVNLGNLSGINTGDQDLNHLATIEALKDSINMLRNEIPAAEITDDDLVNLENLSGVNSGDQDLSHLATIAALKDSIIMLRNEIPDTDEINLNETDPVYLESVAAGITAADTTRWNSKPDSFTESQTLADVLAEDNDGNAVQIKNIADPTDAQDAATKAYVDKLKGMILDLQAGFGLTDERDGNQYKVIRIGNQLWMAENLKYLPSVAAMATGSNTTPHYYVSGYNGTDVAEAKSLANFDTYGVLYNWAAAKLDVCPSGWHLPTDDEWTELTEYLGGEDVAGAKLKASGTTLWNEPNNGATNESGFTALPGGYRDAMFYELGYLGHWWSAGENGAGTAWARHLNYNDTKMIRGFANISLGYSVRCLKD